MLCNECGASIHEKDTKCPFCGALQYDAAENEYMDRLGGIHKNLESLKTEGNRTFTRMFLITFLKTALVSLLFVFLGVAVYYGGEARKQKTSEDEVREIIEYYEWYEEHIDELNSCYMDKDFDKIIEIYYQVVGYYALKTWKHWDISKLYMEITLNMFKMIKALEEGGWVSELSLADAMCNALELIYACDDNNTYYNIDIANLDDEEKKVLAEWKDTAHTFLYDTLKMTEEEVIVINGKVNNGSRYFDSSRLTDLAGDKMDMLGIK